jgi:hypothetical protein
MGRRLIELLTINEFMCLPDTIRDTYLQALGDIVVSRPEYLNDVDNFLRELDEFCSKVNLNELDHKTSVIFNLATSIVKDVTKTMLEQDKLSNMLEDAGFKA